MAARPNQVAHITGDLRRTVNGLMSGMAGVLMDLLVSRNPVATTHSQKNWIASFGTAHSGEVGSRAQPDGSAQEASRRGLSSYDVSMGDIHVANNVWYMELLKEGSSPQAEAGWIDNCVDIVVEHADAIYRRVARVRRTL